MRREVARAAVTAAWIGLVVLAVPLAVTVYLLVVGNERDELERVALRVATRVDASFAVGDPAELPAPEPGGQLGLYDLTGRLQAGSGPAQGDAVTRQAASGTLAQDTHDGMLIVAVPVSAAEQVTAVVRAASPTATVYRRTIAGWAGLAAAMAVALGAAVLVARHRARRLAAPLEQLAAVSRAVGDGDFTARATVSGVAEIDRVATTLNETTARLGELLEHERQFAANASHQLRTPLAGLQIVLETARDTPDANLSTVLDEALATTHRLQSTVEDVLALHRRHRADLDGAAPTAHDGRAGPGAGPVEQVLDEAAARWRGPLADQGRALSLRCDGDVADRAVNGRRVAQILDILLDNALRHGAGRVRVSARSTGGIGDAVAIDIGDEGPGIPDAADDVFRRGAGHAHGIGLSLAREFAVSLGGRLVLATRRPPVFTLLLPAEPDPSATGSGETADAHTELT